MPTTDGRSRPVPVLHWEHHRLRPRTARDDAIGLVTRRHRCRRLDPDRFGPVAIFDRLVIPLRPRALKKRYALVPF